MVSKDCSSKRKSSKRKRDKISSQKKSRRKESKKRSRIHDSVPSYSDDESSNSEHTSKSNHKRRIIIHKNKKPRRDYTTSSSSNDRSLSSDSDSSSRKKARRSRLKIKKRSQKRPKRPKDDEDDERGGRRRKRKRSGRDDVVKPKKKNSSKKKIKKHLSSDSESCSISRSISGTSNTADRKLRRSKLIFDDERERSRGRESYKSRKSRRIRSPSCSSCDRGSKHSVSDGALSPVNDNNININISRRLKSVIAVVDQRYDEEENKLDPHKEEIVYDRNDYPSPKSPDSNEEETKMELDEPELKSRINDGDRQFKAVDVDNFEKGSKEIETSVPVAAVEGDALESILRQKALENLKKFKGRISDLKRNNESNVNRSSSDVIIENVRSESAEPNFQELNQNSGPSLESDLSGIAEVKKQSDSDNVEKEPEMATQAVEQSTEPVSKINTCPGSEITNVGGDFISEPSSTGATMTGEQSLEGGNEAKDGSQFEQKTMTVMRGGEMVQVSYKVYIPKKAPALARRPLKR